MGMLCVGERKREKEAEPNQSFGLGDSKIDTKCEIEAQLN